MRRRTGLIVLSMAVAGCASTHARTRPALLEQDPPADCQALGEVEGRDAQHLPDVEAARQDALRAAGGLGATHVRIIKAKTGRAGAHTEVWTGTAYRCPVKP